MQNEIRLIKTKSKYNKEIKLKSKYNKEIGFLLYAIDLFSKHAQVVPINYKKGVTFVNAFQKLLDSSERKPNKMWVDQGSEYYNFQFENFLKGNNIEIYSTYNEGKSVIAERFIRTLKSKIYNT